MRGVRKLHLADANARSGATPETLFDLGLSSGVHLLSARFNDTIKEGVVNSASRDHPAGAPRGAFSPQTIFARPRGGHPREKKKKRKEKVVS